MSVARALWIEPPESFLEERRQKGLDRRDEMWEGVLHMVPPPTIRHNRRQYLIHRFLDDVVAGAGLATVDAEAGVRRSGSGTSDYRVPDVSVVAMDRAEIRRDWIDGGPDLAVEVRSPGDETYDKMHFFASVGVHELLVVHHDTGTPELYRLAGTQFVAVAPDAEGWLASDRFPVAFRSTGGGLEGQDRSRVERPIHSLDPNP